MTTPPPTRARRVKRDGPGRPPIIGTRKRWALFVDEPVKVKAAAKAATEGTDLSAVMRSLMSKYADGRVKP